MSAAPTLVIHGGTGSKPERTRLARIRASLRAIGAAAAEFLRSHSALETVVYAVRLLEDDPEFNAGTGSALQQDGRARMTASVMDGPRRRFAAVLNIERVRHPVDVASALLEEEDRILAGIGALRFARSRGMRSWDPITPIRRRDWQRRLRDHVSPGTVGAIALDRTGALAAATSTGGKGFERVDRVSDSGLPAGTYATPDAAIACTGIGEDIVDEALAARLAQGVADGATLVSAFARTFPGLRRRRRRLGAIGLDRRGRLAWATTLPVLFELAHTPAGRRESF